MKSLKFKHPLVERILNGAKTSTWRLFDDKNLCIGDELEFVDAAGGKKFAHAKITAIREKKLSEITEKDFQMHERYESREALLTHYRKYYGDRVTLETPVKIIDFKLYEN